MTPGLAAPAHRPRPGSSASGHSDATRLPEGSALPTPGIFWVVFLLRGYFLCLGPKGQPLDTAFPEPPSRLWRDKSSSKLAVTPAVYPGEGPGSDRRGGERLCWADTAPARSQVWNLGPLVMERVCVQTISHTTLLSPLPLGHEQHPSWKTGVSQRLKIP